MAVRKDIIADTAASMLSKIHQIENGTVITSAGNAYILDTLRLSLYGITCRQKDSHILLLSEGAGDLTTGFWRHANHRYTGFNSDKTLNFAIQQISGSEAISLKAADALVYYNFGYSGRNFAQGGTE